MIELLWNNPISETKLQLYLDALDLQASASVLDVGCGAGEMLLRVAAQYDLSGRGIDSSDVHIAEAQRRLKQRTPPLNVEFEAMHASDLRRSVQTFDLVMCIGSTHAFGAGADALARSLTAMRELANPGGLLLAGDAHMKQPADDEYRMFIGDSLPDTVTHESNIAAGLDAGLIPLGAWVSSVDEWDDFEWRYQRVIEKKARESPTDPDWQAKLATRRNWMNAYAKWGRDTLGFGVYLFRNGD